MLWASLNRIFVDPLGVLESGEIFFRSSTPMREAKYGALFNSVVGPVLVSACS